MLWSGHQKINRSTGRTDSRHSYRARTWFISRWRISGVLSLLWWRAWFRAFHQAMTACRRMVISFVMRLVRVFVWVDHCWLMVSHYVLSSLQKVDSQPREVCWRSGLVGRLWRKSRMLLVKCECKIGFPTVLHSDAIGLNNDSSQASLPPQMRKWWSISTWLWHKGQRLEMLVLYRWSRLWVGIKPNIHRWMIRCWLDLSLRNAWLNGSHAIWDNWCRERLNWWQMCCLVHLPSQWFRFFIDFKFEINDFSNKLFISNGSCFISFRSYLFVIAIINDYLLLNIVCLNSDLISK